MSAQLLQVEMAVWRPHAATEAVLAPLAEINAQCVELLCGMAQRPAAVLPPLLAGAPQAWRSLTPGACLKLSGVPWLLVDPGFGAELSLISPLVVAPASGAPFFGSEARDFLRRVLMFSWHMARTHPQLARIALGMTPMASQALSRLRLAELDALAEHSPGALRPRWEHSPGLWRLLLAAAQEEDCTGVAEASLQGIQLLAATCLPPVPNSRAPSGSVHRG